MERNGIGMISLHYSAQNYISLNLSVPQNQDRSSAEYQAGLCHSAEGTCKGAFW